MKKLLLTLAGLCMLISVCGCGSETKDNSKQTEAVKETTIQENTESKETLTTEEPTESEKIYDAYINGQGFNIGDKLQANLIFTTDLTPINVCATFAIFMEGESDWEKIAHALDFDTAMEENRYEEPTIWVTSSFLINEWEGKPASGIWSWYTNHDMNSTESEPEPIYKFNDGQIILEVELTVNEKGNYTIEGKSGNESDEPSLVEQFELYKDAYSIEIIRK